MRGLRRDLGLAWRRLTATPAFAIFSIATLSLGIATTTATLSIVRAMTAPPSGVQDPERIININHARTGGFPFLTFSYGDYLDFRAQQTSFASVTARALTRMSLAAEGNSATSFGEIVGGEYFELLGVKPALGRLLQPFDDGPSATPAAVIAYDTWQGLFASAADVVGRTIAINGQRFQIVGVAPREFHGLFNNGFAPAAAWIPLASVQYLDREGYGYSLDPSDRDRRWLLVKGRLKPGRTIEQAQAELSAIAGRLDRAAPIGRDLDPGLRLPKALSSRMWTLRPMTDILLNENADYLMRPLVGVLLLAVLAVLLVACTNLASLMFARASGRRQELGVRMALGASRGRLIRESLAESGLLAIAGGGLAILLTKILLVLIGTDMDMSAAVTLHVEPRMDGLVLAAAAAAAVLALIASGLGPALRASRTDVRAVLASGGTMASPRWRGRRTFIAVQAMTSLALLIVATACLSEVRRLSQHDSGMDLDHLAIVQVDFVSQKVDAVRAREIAERVIDAITHRPDVEAAAISSGLPVLVTPGGVVTTNDRRNVYVQFMASTPGIFTALHVTIVRGRAFDARDTAASQAVAVISASVATSVFGDMNPIGQTMTLRRRHWVGEPEPQDRLVTVVGVASETDTGSLGQRDGGSVYVPFNQQGERRLVLSARSVAAPAAVAVALRKALAGIDPNIAVQQSGIATTVIGPPNLFLEVAGTIAGILGGFTLLLALTGLYAALSHVVSGRSRELGVRVALGAGERRIIRMVLLDGAMPVVYGMAAGVLLGTMLRLSMRPMFVGLFPAFNAFSLSVAPVCMLIAAAAACYLPARRASRVDPNVALRNL